MNAEFQLRGVGNARLAVHATSSLPAWLWSTDGTRILWANPVGARSFDAPTATALATRKFGPANPYRRQVMQLGGRLPPTGAVRLERLRGFGASLGGLMTCACSRLDFSDGSAGILIAATSAAFGRAMPLVERLQRLLEGVEAPIAAFARDGLFVGANDAAHALFDFRNLSDTGFEAARGDALRTGRVEVRIEIGTMVLQRVGAGPDIGLIALIEPKPPAAAAEQPAAAEPPDPATDAQPPDLAAAAASGKTPAGIALIDAFSEPPADAAEAATVHAEVGEHEPSCLVEAVADESPDAPAAPEPPATASPSRSNGAAPPGSGEPPQLRRGPLRFIWQMDADGCLSLGSDEFTGLIGARTAAAFGRPWSEIVEVLGLDPQGQVERAVATRDTWSGVTLSWPTDSGARLPVELSGLPIYDRGHHFAGYRGFGVCRDLDALSRLALLRHAEFFSDSPPEPPPLQSDAPPLRSLAPPSRPQAPPSWPNAAPLRSQAPQLRSQAPPLRPQASPSRVPQSLSAHVTRYADIEAEPARAAPFVQEPVVRETSPPREPDTAVETPKNVLPFRPVNEAKLPSLTQVENNTFNELSRQLAARLEAEEDALTRKPDPPVSPVLTAQPLAPQFLAPQFLAPELLAPQVLTPQEAPDPGRERPAVPGRPEQHDEPPAWLSAPEPPAHGEMLRDRSLLDLLPVGVLIYRLDRLLYANRAFLDRIGYASLQALEAADGLDALFVEPVALKDSSTSGTGTAVTIAATPASADRAPLPPTEARLFTISWDGDSALALICSNAGAEPAPVAAAVAKPSPVGHGNVEELGAILDATAEGLVMFDADGVINCCNRGAEALFGYDGDDLIPRNLADLFAPESQRPVMDYVESIKGAGVAGLLDHGRDVLGRVRRGGLIALSMTIGRTRPDGPTFFAVFRDLSQAKKNEAELLQARRLAERSAHAKADVLARISHEVRAPLNAIIGFAEVMIDERFGTLGNERYVEYMRDIRASGERVMAIINDLLDLSRIESGKIDLAFTNQNLNELVENCVAVMQPQASRERIIIRTSLAQPLPAVVADGRALRQIALNLIGSSIHLANAGGQVIVSTALSDFGEVVLRVRDTGHGLNDNELAAALEPFRSHGPADRTSDRSAISLSLTKALVEANRAQFQIKTAPHSGTLIEVVFARRGEGMKRRGDSRSIGSLDDSIEREARSILLSAQVPVGEPDPTNSADTRHPR
jgi:PAS domain S-box-containing protein